MKRILAISAGLGVLLSSAAALAAHPRSVATRLRVVAANARAIARETGGVLAGVRFGHTRYHRYRFRRGYTRYTAVRSYLRGMRSAANTLGIYSLRSNVPAMRHALGNLIRATRQAKSALYASRVTSRTRRRFARVESRVYRLRSLFRRAIASVRYWPRPAYRTTPEPPYAPNRPHYGHERSWTPFRATGSVNSTWF